MGLTKYLKAAFLGRWNLLAFLGGVGFALVSGIPDVMLPLVLAGETVYLGFLGTHPRFQKYVEAQEAKGTRTSGKDAAELAARRILNELPKEMLQRFEAVRARCTELRKIAGQIRDPDRTDEPPPLDDLQVAGLDRLLWMYLRLLFTHYSLTQFLKQTSVEQIQKNISQLEEKLKSFPEQTTDPRQQRLQKVVQENLQTSRARLANYEKAKENHELMSLEIDRLENTIHSLSELAVNRQEPEFITAQIDQVANGMVQTERTMGQLSFVTGLKLANEEVPQMLPTEVVNFSE
jgi:hypothetical protein